MRRSLNQGGKRQANAPRRATFMADAAPLAPQQQTGWTSAEDAFDAFWQPGAQPANPAQDDPWDAPFVPSSQQWYEAENNQSAYPPAAPVQERPQRAGRRSFPIISVLVTLLSLSLIAACAINITRAGSAQPAFEAKLRDLKGQAFFPGISIDGIDVSGRTPSQVRELAGQEGLLSPPKVNISLIVDQTAYQFDNSHLPFERNLEAVMEAAWSIGRQGSYLALSSQWTPFEYRWRHMAHTREKGAGFLTEVSYSRSVVDELAASLANQVRREPVNAVVSSFNFITKAFEVTQDIPGRQLDAQAVASALRQALDNRDYQARITLHAAAILPRVSSVDLRNGFTQLASFSTRTTSDEDRNNNIALAAQAINNRTLLPGEVFSFNETTGQRTIQKGYRGAPAIQGGVLIDDVGGGVCQVSSTLFYAAASAGMSIVDRSPHAWPVSYMDKGLDATVNWPNLDFKFRNDQATPVFIIAQYAKRTLTIEFYGMISAPGEGIRLEAQLVSTEQPPREPMMQPNPSLPFGTQKELKQARTGYVVDTFRVYLRNGNEYRREKLFTSKYRMVQQVIEFN